MNGNLPAYLAIPGRRSVSDFRGRQAPQAPGLLEIVSGQTKRDPFSQPELTDDERSAATRYGVMTGMMAGQRSGLVGGILGAMLGGKQGRERRLYDKYLEQRLGDPSYGSEHTDRLMAQRYGGEGYLRAPVKQQPQRPISHTKYEYDDQGELMRHEGFVDPQSLTFTGTGDPFPPSAIRSPTGQRSAEVDERKSSEVQGARTWARNLHKNQPSKWAIIRSGRSYDVNVMDTKQLQMLTERDPGETQEEHSAWLAELADMSAPPARTPAKPGRDWGADTEKIIRKGLGLVGQLGGSSTPQDASDLRQRLIDEGALSP